MQRRARRHAALLLLQLCLLACSHQHCRADSLQQQPPAADAAAAALWPLVPGRSSSSTSSRRLHASCDTGSFPELKPTVLDSKAAGVEWAGGDDMHVFLTTVKAATWRSKDGGSTFEDISQRFKSSIKTTEPVQITQILSHKTKPAQMIFVGAGEYMWTSQDYGDTLTPHKTPGGFKGSGARLRAHPSRPDWVLAHAKRPGCRLLDEVEMRCAADLFVAEDAFTAMSWRNLTAAAAGKVAGFVDWGWAQEGCAKAAAAASSSGSGGSASPSSPHGCDGLGLPDSALFATMYEHPGDWDTAWDPDVHFVRSDDWFKSIKQKIPCGNQFELLGRQTYLAVSNRCPTDWAGKPRSIDPTAPPGITLFTSVDGGAHFNAACMPIALRQEGYELLEAHDGQGAVVIVDYLVKTPLGNLQASSAYTAGPRHALFSLTLSSIHKQDMLSSSTDFLRVDGVPGVFIANQLSATASDTPYGIKIKPAVQTRITFNGGGTWGRIPAPTSFAHSSCDRCGGAKECSLHLHGASAWFFGAVQFPSVYSNPSAPGLLVASGNVAGEDGGLDDNDGVCTWLSYDGGATWADVAEGTWIYEYADWGGLVVMAKHELNGPADEVRFSHDYGRCWRSVPLATAMYVENIRIEPDGQRPKVLLHGKACRRAANPKCSYDATDTRASIEGLVYAVDIAALMGSSQLPACKAGSDYEEWSPPGTDAAHPRCLLGAHRTFTRRKQDARCLQGADYKRPAASAKPCKCEASDAECDYGFVSDGGGGCRALPQEKLSACPSVDSGAYVVSASGKRLVHGDVCEGVAAVIPDTDGRGALNPGSKPGVQPHGGGGGDSSGSRHKASGLFVAFVVLGVAGGVFGAWYQFLASPLWRARVQDAAADMQALVASVAGWSLDRVAVLLGRLRGGGVGGGAFGGGVLSTAAAPYVPLDEEELNYFQPLPEASIDVAELPIGGGSSGGGGGGSGVYTLR